MSQMIDTIIDFFSHKGESPKGDKIVTNPHQAYLHQQKHGSLSISDTQQLIELCGYNAQTAHHIASLKRHDTASNTIWRYLKYAAFSEKILGYLCWLLVIIGLFSEWNLLFATGVGLYLWGRLNEYRLWKQLDALWILESSTELMVEHQEQAEIHWVVKNRSDKPLYDLLLSIPSPFSSEGIIWASIPTLAPNSIADVAMQCSVDKGVGCYQLDTLCVSLSDGIGLHTLSVEKTIQLSVQVAPQAQPLLDIPLPIGGRPDPAGTHETTREGNSCNFFQLRPWRHGDSIRHIHWGRSLRLDELLVLTFEATAQLEATLLIDYRQVGHSDFDTLSSQDTLINTLFSLCHSFSQEKIAHRVISEHWDTGMGSGSDHLQMLSALFKSSEPKGTLSLSELLIEKAHEILPGTLLILFCSTASFDIESALLPLYGLIKNSVQIMLIATDSTFYSTQLTTMAHSTDPLAWQSIQAYQEIIEKRQAMPQVATLLSLISQRTYILKPFHSLNDALYAQ